MKMTTHVATKITTHATLCASGGGGGGGGAVGTGSILLDPSTSQASPLARAFSPSLDAFPTSGVSLPRYQPAAAFPDHVPSLRGILGAPVWCVGARPDRQNDGGSDVGSGRRGTPPVRGGGRGDVLGEQVPLW